ncbi:hypothetical protein OAJ99_00245 [Candidatus Poseidoniales archaeon]|nr:hypothetical protein [Candidatus Poseidoniales archaeon]
MDEHHLSEWIRGYLEEYSDWPLNGQLKIGVLKRRYLIWEHFENFSKLTSRDCALFDIYLQFRQQYAHLSKDFDSLKDVNPYHTMELSGEVEVKLKSRLNEHISFEQMKNFILENGPGQHIIPQQINATTWKYVIKILDDQVNDIVADGDNRGRTYRHIRTRPLLSGFTIAKIIERILKHEQKEVRWNSLFPHISPIIKQIHAKIESEQYERSIPVYSKERVLQWTRPEAPLPSLPPSSSEPAEFAELAGIAIFTLEFQQSTIQLDLPILEMAYPTKNLQQRIVAWIDMVYNETWFRKKSSEIQRILKHPSIPVGQGSRRGYWLHESHPDFAAILKHEFRNRMDSLQEQFHSLHESAEKEALRGENPELIHQLSYQVESFAWRIGLTISAMPATEASNG